MLLWPYRSLVFGPKPQHKMASFDSHAVEMNTCPFGSPRGWFIPIHSQRVVSIATPSIPQKNNIHN